MIKKLNSIIFMIPLYTFDFQLYVNIFGFNLTTKQYTFSKADDITLHDGYAKTLTLFLPVLVKTFFLFKCPTKFRAKMTMESEKGGGRYFRISMFNNLNENNFTLK